MDYNADSPDYDEAGEEQSSPGQTAYTDGAGFWRNLTENMVSLDAALITGAKHIDAMMRLACSETEIRVWLSLPTVLSLRP